LARRRKRGWPEAGIALNYEVDTVTHRVGDHEYRLRMLRDRQQYADPDGDAERAGISSAEWPLFGILWPSGLALAEEIATFPIEGKRVLEVGCGIGLCSLVLQRRGADVTATDYHPLAEEFLRYNAALNELPPPSFRIAAWGSPNAALGSFDLIVGADVLYARDQPALLAGFLERHARPQAQIMIADPGRRQWSQFAGLMARQGYALAERRLEPRGRLALFSR
jgi:predicted nicotinamide N-methyase